MVDPVRVTGKNKVLNKIKAGLTSGLCIGKTYHTIRKYDLIMTLFAGIFITSKARNLHLFVRSEYNQLI